jgi:hypothetical protein
MAYSVETYTPNRKGPVSALMYGPAGSGKTTLAASFPEPLIIDMDRGLKSLEKPVKRIKLAGVAGAYDIVIEILRDALLGTGEFAAGKSLVGVKTIIIDSITALANEYLMPELMLTVPDTRKTEGPKFEEYGKLKYRMNQLSSIIKDLSAKMNVILTATPIAEKDDRTGITMGRPDIIGSYRETIGAVVDEEYYLEAQVINGAAPKFKLYAAPRGVYEAKTRTLSKFEFENATYPALQAALKPQA